MARIHLKQIDNDYQFATTDEAGQIMTMDIPVDQGGHGNGVRPMQALLSALGGCSGVDIVMILKKQKIELDKIYADLYKFYKEDYSRELNKGDIEYYINKDESYYTKNNEYQIQESICMYLESIVKRANGLSFDVKNYIDLKLFMAGSK